MKFTLKDLGRPCCCNVDHLPIEEKNMDFLLCKSRNQSHCLDSQMVVVLRYVRDHLHWHSLTKIQHSQ